MRNRSLIGGGILVFVACVLGVLIYSHSDEDLFLVAKDVVPVYGSADEATSSSPQVIAIAKLKRLENVLIVQCIDMKHYQIYRIRLPNGHHGFVNEGNYQLVRDGKPSSC